MAEHAAAPRGPTGTPALATGEMAMVIVTSLVIGFLATDRLLTGYIGPYLVSGLDLSITQFGSLYSVQAVAVAVSGVVIGRFSDRSGKRKRLLIPLLLLAALAALSVFLADGYAQLLAVRLCMGLALGGLTPIIQSIVATSSSPGKMGRNIGIQTLLMFLLSQMASPLVAPRLADAYGWQATYGLMALPFLALAAMVAIALRRDGGSAAGESAAASPQTEISAQSRRTVALCVAISACFMLWLVIHATFLSVFLVEVRHLAPTRAGEMLSVLGIAGAAGGLFLPLISDRIGLRRTLVAGMTVSLLVPVTVLFWTGPEWSFQLLLFVGWLSVGGLPIYAIMVPGQVVPPARMAATIALTTGAGEVIGGIGGPLIAGQLADRFGLQAPFFLTGLMAIMCVVLATRLNPAADAST